LFFPASRLLLIYRLFTGWKRPVHHGGNRRFDTGPSHTSRDLGESSQEEDNCTDHLHAERRP
jgi:hypothetical protein